MTVSALRWFKAALVLQVLLLGYWLAIEVVDFYPWNDIAARPAEFDLRGGVAVTGLALCGLMVLFALGVQPLAVLSVIGYGVYLAIQLWIWWKPYVIGADPAWQGVYDLLYERTLKLLPADAAHLAPDAQHLVLQGLTLLTLIAGVMAAARMRHL
jgi:hypothetical protein